MLQRDAIRRVKADGRSCWPVRTIDRHPYHLPTRTLRTHGAPGPEPPTQELVTVPEWILALAASPLVYLVLYLFATIDGFFPPIPSESVVIALAAMSAASGQPNIALILLVAAAGAFTGDQIAYAIGRRVDVRGLRFLRGPRGQRTLDWAERAITHRGPSFILAARYVPIGRVAVNMTAGALGYPRRRFVPLSAAAGITWSLYSVGIGLGAGVWFQENPVLAICVGVFGGVLLGLVVDWTLSRRERRRPRRLAAQDVARAREASEQVAVGQSVGANCGPELGA